VYDGISHMYDITIRLSCVGYYDIHTHIKGIHGLKSYLYLYVYTVIFTLKKKTQFCALFFLGGRKALAGTIIHSNIHICT